MNGILFGVNRWFPGEGNRFYFLLLTVVLFGIVYPESESVAQIMYPDYVMHIHSSSPMADNLYAEGMSLFNARKFDSSATYLSRAFKMYDTMGDDDNRLLALTQLTSAYGLIQNVDYARRYVVLIPPMLDDTANLDKKKLVYCAYGLANIYEVIGEYKKGMKQIQRARRLYQSFNLDDKWLLGKIYYINGALEDDFAFYDRAVNYTKQSLEIAKEQDSDRLKILLVDSYNALGIFAYRDGKYALSADYLMKEIGTVLRSPFVVASVHMRYKTTNEKKINNSSVSTYSKSFYLFIHTTNICCIYFFAILGKKTKKHEKQRGTKRILICHLIWPK